MAAGDCGEAEAEAEGRLVKKETGEERSEDGEAVREFQFRHSLPTSSFTPWEQQTALLFLKASISDPLKILANNWSATAFPCDWTGISCSSLHNRVTAVNISRMALSGSLPSHLGNLSFLVSLDLSGNNFQGLLPHEFVRLRRLRFINLAFNNYTGEVPSWFGFLPNLQFLNFRNNTFTGSLPASLLNASKLERLDLSFNSIEGRIPEEFGEFLSLRSLIIQVNKLSGHLPPAIFNICTLEILSFTKNSLSGHLPDDICSRLPNLIVLFLSFNELDGKIPPNLSQCSSLQNVEVNICFKYDNCPGVIPEEIGNLHNLIEIVMESNNLSGSIPLNIFNITSLQTLSFTSNKLSGPIPRELGRLASIQKLQLGNKRYFTGEIPEEISNLSLLVELELADNNLTGNIPAGIFNISSLRKMELTMNDLSDFLHFLHKLQKSSFLGNPLNVVLPNTIGQLATSLYEFLASGCRIKGNIPEEIGNLSSLVDFYLADKELTGQIPTTIQGLQNTQRLSFANNRLTGLFPTSFCKLQHLGLLELDGNQLSGAIPECLENMSSLRIIPESLGRLLGLETLDLSQNNLSGSIPESSEALQYLTNFNVFLNDLSGRIPSGGPFQNFTSQSFLYNEALCGSPKFDVPLCVDTSNRKSEKRVAKTVSFTLVGIVALVPALTFAFLLHRYRRQKQNKGPNQTDQFDVTQTMRISYYEIRQAREGYNEDNLIGKGSFGSVYKGILKNGTLVAIKVFNLQSEEDAFRSFDRECEVLRNLRHRNLTKIISCCSNNDFKALPSNILFDEDMIAHVSDFGLAKLLGDEGNSFARTKSLATFGYMAPEYGTDGLVSTKSDIYSFGILLMETFSGRKLGDETFSGDFSLKQLVFDSLSDNIIWVVDSNLFTMEDEYFGEKLECTKSILELALSCCLDSPGQRINIRDAMTVLKNIKLQLSALSQRPTLEDVRIFYVEVIRAVNGADLIRGCVGLYPLLTAPGEEGKELGKRVLWKSQIANDIMERENFYYCASACVSLVVHFLMVSLAMGTTNISTDKTSLLALKSTISDPTKILTNNWSSETSPCDWIGISCSSLHNRVTALNISKMGLSGSISPQFGNLSFLVSIDFSSNNFHGFLPQEFVRLRRLRFISLAFNNFIGEIPSWFGFLPNLQFLNLKNNSFTGSLPATLSNASKLESLDFSFNSIEGMIPKEFGDFLSLRILIVQFNTLTGNIPSAIFNITTLETLSFTKNRLSGNLPVDICSNLPNLNVLFLSFNKLYGRIPSNLSQCSSLQRLSLSYNNFFGSVPKELGKLENLQKLYLGGNHLTGVIPVEIGDLHNLIEIAMESNNISGPIPLTIFNISSLQTLSFTLNKLSGQIPAQVGRLANLQKLQLGGNRFKGKIPEEMSNLSQLVELELSTNDLIGKIPVGIFNISSLRKIEINVNHFSGNLPSNLGYGLPNLQILRVDGNNLTGFDPTSISDSIQLPELSFFNSLTSCKNLQYLSVSGNPLNGVLPNTIGQLSTSLEEFLATGCGIKGSIPEGIGNLSSVVDLSLSDNELTGMIPTTIQGLNDLQRISFTNNQLTGSIPSSLCQLQNLGLLELNGNQLSGSIPECLETITSLRYLYLQKNRLNSSIPSNLGKLHDLLELNLSSNSFSGSLPQEIDTLKALTTLDLSVNNFSGPIPSTIGGLQDLVYLSLAQNRLQGSIPESLGSLLALETLDLSRNNLSGSIPESLEALLYLTNFNVSMNDLSGPIPSDGPFKNFTSQSFLSNDALCGSPKFNVTICTGTSNDKSRRKLIKIVLFTLLGTFALVLALTIAFILYSYQRQKQKEKKGPNQNGQFDGIQTVKFSYHELLQATEGYTEANLIGKGSFGSVYKGILKNGTIVAVKVFNLQLEEEAFRSFDRECEVLRNLRHRNLTKIISSCSNCDFKALVLEYMPNGNLENWLYSEDHSLDMEKRLDTMIDVASALDYLHNGYSESVVHCDLKPSNILFDENMVAHVSDFGLSKLLGDGNSIVHTKTLATFGYMAPEYGTDGLVSTKSDVYSFGILLMETFSRKKPSDEMFDGDFSLKQLVTDLLSESVIGIIDTNLLTPEDKYFDEKLVVCIKPIMELALSCCFESPGERINIREATVTLKNIKLQLSMFGEK
ncbi:hypothetical protein M9H77_04383 [Catharanthus roseus]|uniref:Uncharacterized protein n=1 Tax=Catharanthus roseus TaxID=4058 RepID=A0ACC0CE36_CATRO|nr:hypothetical protein M9H77_04383 [Catharanthus roseus]